MEEKQERAQETKWCPMARLSVTDAHGGLSGANRFDSGDLRHYSRVNCIADNCAVWVGSKAKGRCGLINL